MGKSLAGLAMIMLAVALSSCGAPQYTYVANTDAHTYFKVPWGWHKLSAAALASALHTGSGSSAWTVGYDASTAPSSQDVLGGRTSQPFAFAFVTKLNATMSNAMSYNSLRDLYLPVTVATRQNATQRGFQLHGFHLLRDTVLTPGQGIHGVRVIYNYTFPDGSTDTFDQVAFTNSDDTEVYLLVTHCLATCYQLHRGEIETVMQSFTVRSNG